MEREAYEGDGKGTGRGRCVTLISGAFKQGKGGVVSVLILEYSGFFF